MNHEFTKKLGQWLNADPAERDIMEGADLLLKLTGNKILYSAVRLNPAKYKAHVEYQLQKHYNYRVADLTLEELKTMKQEATEKSAAIGVDSSEESTTEKAAAFAGYGRRPDHDSLPDELKQLYADNLEIRRKMQQLHLQIRTKYNELTNCTASDVYALVRELLRYEDLYNSNWAKYDGFNSVTVTKKKSK